VWGEEGGSPQSINLAALPARIKVEHQAVEYHASNTVLHCVRAGQLLILAKGMMRHGEFGDWLEASCRVSDRQAHRYMAAARRFAVAPNVTRAALLEMSLRQIEALPAPDEQRQRQKRSGGGGRGLVEQAESDPVQWALILETSVVESVTDIVEQLKPTRATVRKAQVARALSDIAKACTLAANRLSEEKDK
jgi:hypothetical protein